MRCIPKILRLAAGALLAVCASQALAIDVVVISPSAVKGPVMVLAEQFERATGQHVRLEFSTAGAVDDKLKAGSTAELVINSHQRLLALKDAKLVAEAPRELGNVKIGVAVRKGAPRPDLSSAEAFRASLLKVESLSYADPARGATTGVHFGKMLANLGLADTLKNKSTLVADGIEVMDLVERGVVELGVTQVSEIRNVYPEGYVGPLPEALQLTTTYSIALRTKSAGDAARQFLDLLLSPIGRARFIAAGFQ